MWAVPKCFLWVSVCSVKLTLPKSLLFSSASLHHLLFFWCPLWSSWSRGTLLFNVSAFKKTRSKALEKLNSGNSRARMVRGDREFNTAPPLSQEDDSWNGIRNGSRRLLKNINATLIQLNGRALKPHQQMFVLFLLCFAATMSEQEEYFMIRRKKRRECKIVKKKAAYSLCLLLVCVSIP